ncbi:hypothetical protein [Rhodoferax sp. AJA081-3]|uniref:hypothetical protein n=1 Tax=Rhodoferax sp. AJA081-3 TaxID=2752316 RepID=UPI001FD783A7|nr:hypothetical protein [Rhodoferax sp. AJA081-3]
MSDVNSNARKPEDYLESIRRDGYVLIKQAVPLDTVNDLLAYVNSFEYSSEQQTKIDSNLQRLNGYGSTVYNVVAKRPEVLRLFIRGVAGELLKGMLNDKYYHSWIHPCRITFCVPRISAVRQEPCRTTLIRSSRTAETTVQWCNACCS